MPWFHPLPKQQGYKTANSIHAAARDPRRRTTGLPLPTTGGPWLTSGQPPSKETYEITMPKLDRFPPNSRNAQANRPAISAAGAKSANMQKLAKSAQPIDPVALAAKPIYRRSMERTTRIEQLKQSPIQGQFVKSNGPRKPKGSINLPRASLLAAKLTSVPAKCWPADTMNKQRMWTNPTSPQPARAGPLAPPLYMLTLPDLTRFKHDIRPLSPLPASPIRISQTNTNTSTPPQSLPQRESVKKPSVNFELKQKQVTLTPTSLDTLSTTKKRTMSESEMDLDATFVEGKRTNSSAEGTPPAKKPNTMKALANSYQTRVQNTKAKLLQKKTGSATLPSLPKENYETEMYHELVKPSDTPVAAPSYENAPTVTQSRSTRGFFGCRIFGIDPRPANDV